MKRTLYPLWILYAAACGCSGNTKNLETQSVTVGENTCIIQKMPASFQEDKGSDKGSFDYFRVIMQSKVKLMDSSQVNYVNFGMEQSIKKVTGKDTLYPAFVQRVANGKKENYEYIVSFAKNTEGKHYEIIIDDDLFEMGTVSMKF